MAKNSDFYSLFHPQTVAHVGSSPNVALGRFNFTDFLNKMQYKGNLCPVNPKYQEVLGHKCYPDLESVPGVLDLAILAVPAKVCPGVLAKVSPGKIKFVVIHTSGFGEINKKGLEQELLHLAKEKGFRIVGPNCMGVFCQAGRVGFWGDHGEAINTPGSVAMISQSGGNAINVIENGMFSGTRFNKAISLGNQIDVSINEILEYFGNDDSIGVIGIYVEQVPDARKFLDILKKTTAKKPVVVWKGGLTQKGKAAAATHTGSIAGNEEIFAAAMRQAGVVIADDMVQFGNMIRMFQPEFKLPRSRVAIFSPGGGNTVSMSDMFSLQPNITVPSFSVKTQKILTDLLPEENVDVKNPVDTGAASSNNLIQIFEAVTDDENIDMLVMMMDVDFLDPFPDDSARKQAIELYSIFINDLVSRKNKPVYLLLQQQRKNHAVFNKFWDDTIKIIIEKRIPWIAASFKQTAETLSRMIFYTKYREKHSKLTY